MATKFTEKTRRGRRLAIFEFREVRPLKDDVLLKRIYEAWKKTQSPVGYSTYTDIYVYTRIPYIKIFGVLKWFQQLNPKSIHFNIDRYGKNVYLKFDTKR